jgi:lantibiotic modifying enzyme
MSDMPFPFTAPNFAHGGAGVGYFFAQLHDRAEDQRFLDAAISAGEYVLSRRSPVDPTSAPGAATASLICHTEEQKPPIFYLGECHGPAGTWRLFQTLARKTNDIRWADAASGLLDGLDAIKAPAVRSPGWWNNHSQCCGDAGLGDTALAMAAATGNPRYTELANACASVIEQAATVAGGRRSWSQAEHRARPKFVQAQSGYMQGGAGIGSFLVHLATAGRTDPARIWFPDEAL